MLRNALVGLAAAALLSATFVPDDALAYRGGGARVHAGGARAVGVRGGDPYRGAAVGAAALGAATVGAAAGYYGSGYDNSGCYSSASGYLDCPSHTEIGSAH